MQSEGNNNPNSDQQGTSQIDSNNGGLNIEQMCAEVEMHLKNMSQSGNRTSKVKESTQILGRFFERDDSIEILLRIIALGKKQGKKSYLLNR